MIKDQQNEQEFVVESIDVHNGNRQRRSTMETKVRWVGFGESCDSWEPYMESFTILGKLVTDQLSPFYSDHEPTYTS